MKPLELFQRKCLKSFLQLSEQATTPAIHFLTGELPIEGKIHIDVFSLLAGQSQLYKRLGHSSSRWRWSRRKIAAVIGEVFRA